MTDEPKSKPSRHILRKLLKNKFFLFLVGIIAVVSVTYFVGRQAGVTYQKRIDDKKIAELTKINRLAPVGFSPFSGGPTSIYSAGKLSNVSDKTFAITDPLGNKTIYAFNDHTNITDSKGAKIERSKLKKDQLVVVTGTTKPDGTKLVQRISVKD